MDKDKKKISRITRKTPASVRNSKSKLTDKVFSYSLDARPDTVDFRDLMFIPTLKEVPRRITINDYRSKVKNIEILDQGTEGSCTGYALANVANFLLSTRGDEMGSSYVSAKMIYEFAKKYDEWPGEKYSGSSVRGAIKAWHKHGVCSEEVWKKIQKTRNTKLKYEMLMNDSRARPLGAYFRVNHKDLVAMHSAMAEVGILYASANVHENWKNPLKKKVLNTNLGKEEFEFVIPFNADEYRVIGGHAFSIVAYDSDGFWVQNSWGKKWGDEGFAKMFYDDWLLNGTDVWVARLGVPVNIFSSDAKSSAFSISSTAKNESSFYEFRPHIVSIGNDGKLKADGTYGNTEEGLRNIIAAMDTVIKEFEDKNNKKWAKRKILLYAHGGLVPEESVLQRLSDYRETMLNNEVYPVFFMWHSDLWSTLKNILTESLSKTKTEDILGGIKDFMLDRIDDALEFISRGAGRALWEEMKENALGATVQQDGGARKFITMISDMIRKDKKHEYEIHLIGHSAGSILLAPLIELLAGKGKINVGLMKGSRGLEMKIDTCTLWAPACTVELFLESYAPHIADSTLRNFELYTLTDFSEREDNCAKIYNKSLLYLVSNAFEKDPRIPLTLPYGTPVFGMEKFLNPRFWNEDEERKINNKKMKSMFVRNKSNANVMKDLFEKYKIEWVKSPDDSGKSSSQTHGGFDDDRKCVESTFKRIAKYSAKDLKEEGELIQIDIKPSSVNIKERIRGLAGRMKSV